MELRQAFQILEISPDTAPEEIKRQYRDLVNIWHPDRFGSNPRLSQKAEDRLKQINEAWETVSAAIESGSLNQANFDCQENNTGNRSGPTRPDSHTAQSPHFDQSFRAAAAKPRSFFGTLMKGLFLVSLVSSAILMFKHREFIVTFIQNPSAAVDGAVNRALMRSPAGGPSLGISPQKSTGNTAAPQPVIKKPPKPKTRTFVEIHLKSGSIITANSYRIDGDMLVYRVAAGSMGVERSKVEKVEVKTVTVR